MTKLLEKHNIEIRRAAVKYKHTHTVFLEAFNKDLTKLLFKPMDAQEFQDPEKASTIWVKYLDKAVKKNEQHSIVDDWYDLIVRLELNSSEKVILCTRDTLATYKLSDILLEFDTIFDQSYASSISEMYTGTTSILYTKVTSIHYQTLSKKDTTWKTEVNNLSYLFIAGFTITFPW